MEQTIILPTGETRLAEEAPDLQERLAAFGVHPSQYIPGFRVSYRELDNICRWMRDQGWMGAFGLDEAVRTFMRDPK